MSQPLASSASESSSNFLKSWNAWWGLEFSAVSAKEKLVSILGGFVATLLLLALADRFPGGSHASALIGSMGATAVLLFAVPHGQLSQPWPVLAGHAFSAALGVACAKWIPAPELAGACAVALSVGAMHQFKCIHPPGGATALTAVIGGQAIHDLGFRFVLFPVILNAVVMIAIAVVYNFAFRWRRYPTVLTKTPAAESGGKTWVPSHAEIEAAIRQLDSFVDITEEDLVRLVHGLEVAHAGKGGLSI